MNNSDIINWKNGLVEFIHWVHSVDYTEINIQLDLFFGHIQVYDEFPNSVIEWVNQFDKFKNIYSLFEHSQDNLNKSLIRFLLGNDSHDNILHSLNTGYTISFSSPTLKRNVKLTQDQFNKTNKLFHALDANFRNTEKNI